MNGDTEKKTQVYKELLNAMHKSKDMNDVKWDKEITYAKKVLEQTLEALDTKQNNEEAYWQYSQMSELLAKIYRIVDSLTKLHCETETLKAMLQYADASEKIVDAMNAAKRQACVRFTCDEEKPQGGAVGTF